MQHHQRAHPQKLILSELDAPKSRQIVCPVFFQSAMN